MIQRQNVESPVVPAETTRKRDQTRDFLSGLAVVLSTLAFIVSGFNAYQIAGLRGEIQLANNTAPEPANSTIGSPAPSAQTGNSASPNSAPATNTQTATTTAPVQASPSNSTVQPGQYIQPALGDIAQIEILSVRRVQNPETGTRDVVDVQMRVQRVGDRARASDIINLNDTTARSADTNVIYQTVNRDQAGGAVSLFQISPGSAAEVNVQLGVPEEVNTLDIFVPETGAFRRVPIG